jgi:hypothetical protein
MEIIDQVKYMAQVAKRQDMRNVLAAAADEIERLQISDDRYEFIRTLTPVAFSELWMSNVQGDGNFDDLVDKARAI